MHRWRNTSDSRGRTNTRPSFRMATTAVLSHWLSSDDSSESAFFALFVPDAYIDSMVQYTNAYAEQRGTSCAGTRAAAASAAPQ